MCEVTRSVGCACSVSLNGSISVGIVLMNGCVSCPPVNKREPTTASFLRELSCEVLSGGRGYMVLTTSLGPAVKRRVLKPLAPHPSP